MPPRPIVLALLSLALAPGCRAFDESLLDSGTTDAGPGCELRLPPVRPAGGEGPDVEEMVFAIRDLVVDQRDERWRTAGYDLDGLCTLTEMSPVECLPPSPSAPRETDGEGGTDNAMGHQIIPILIVAMPNFEEESRGNQNVGLGVILIRIRGWNGAANDPLVDVTLTQSVIGSSVEYTDPIVTLDVDADQRLIINGEDWPVPAWDGNDVWWARADSFLERDIEQPRVRDDNAYVANHTLVMRLPDRFPIVLGGPTRAAQFILTDVVFTVRISADRQTVETSILAGRFDLTEFRRTIVSAGACPGTSDYASFSRVLDLAADVRAMPGSGGPTATCDAVSVGIPFESGIRASIVGIIDGFGTPTPCTTMDGGVPDGGSDAGASEAGPPDSGLPDSGPSDAGPDAGPPDAGP